MSSSSSLQVKMEMRSGGINWWKPSLKASICSIIPLLPVPPRQHRAT